MFVCSCTHDCLLSSEHTPSLDDVRKDHSIQVPDMRSSVHVEDGRGDVVWLLRRRVGRMEPPGAIIDRAWPADARRASSETRVYTAQGWNRRIR